MNSEISGSKKRRIMIITADESVVEQLQNNTNSSLFKTIILDTHDDHVDVQSVSHKKQKNGSLTCVVCNSPANGYNFDVISCESCKAFFRRNALKDPATLECRRNSDCDVTSESRRRCAACRLTKCLNSGMKRDRLLTAEQKAARIRQIEENRSLTLKTNVESHDNQQTSTLVPIKHEPDDEQSQILATTVRSHISMSKNTNLLLVNDYTDLLPHKSSSEQRTLLSSEDLQRVETIQLSYGRRIELAAREGLPWNPSIYANTLLEHVNAHSVSALRLVSFFKQIPEFNELNVHDRVTLIKYNLMPLVILNCTLAYDIKTDTFQESSFDAPWNSNIILTLHGDTIYQRVKKIFESFTRIAQYDQRIIQLALIILILTKGFSTNSSSSEPILNDGIAVFRAQNYYIELLWKYLESMHGYEKAIQIFNELVIHFISWQTLQGCMARKLLNVLTPAEMNELLPIMKSLIHVE